jgi:hypothetical protein
VKNLPVTIGAGCTTIVPPAFLTGPNAGKGWLRITVSDNPVTDDFPWAGSAPIANNLRNGETEDYPVTITPPQAPCPDYGDWGDAPEAIQAYPSGVLGHFPTCSANTAPGTQTSTCAPISTPPGLTGYVRHVSTATDAVKYWLGCGNTALGSTGVDSETDGKVNVGGGSFSNCAAGIFVDCFETAFGLTFGQDECTGDPTGDAGILSPVSFSACATSTVRFNTFNCRANAAEAFLNISSTGTRTATGATTCSASRARACARTNGA